MRGLSYAGGGTESPGGEQEVKKRNRLFVYQVISREAESLTARLNHMPLKGRKTSPEIVKRVKEEVDDMSFDIARACNVLVNYPRLSIQGDKVSLGEPSILLPNCRYVSLEQLKEIEEKRR